MVRKTETITKREGRRGGRDNDRLCDTVRIRKNMCFQSDRRQNDDGEKNEKYKIVMVRGEGIYRVRIADRNVHENKGRRTLWEREKRIGSFCRGRRTKSVVEEKFRRD